MRARCKRTQPPPVLAGSLSFEDPIADRESLLAACLELALPADPSVEESGEAGRLVLLLSDENHTTHELHLRPSTPLRSPAPF